MMNEHLSSIELNSMADGELSAEQMTEVNSHLVGCPACTTKALSQMMLKSAAGRVGKRYGLPDDARERVLQKVAQQTMQAPMKASVRGKAGWVGWSTAAALLLGVLALGVMQRGATARSEEAALVTEVSDQHVAMMAANAPPEVVSSDRHTVKPWFQGKLPFSFNLPTDLASDTTLDGANLAYLGHRPVAQLLYSIGKHRASVFVREKDSSSEKKELMIEQAGFHVMTESTGELELVAVSDVDPNRLQELVHALGQAQGK